MTQSPPHQYPGLRHTRESTAIELNPIAISGIKILPRPVPSWEAPNMQQVQPHQQHKRRLCTAGIITLVIVIIVLSVAFGIRFSSENDPK